MIAHTVEECFRLRLLRKIQPDTEKSRKSLELARMRLLRGAEAVEAGFFEFAILEAYMTMFHAARAVLYKDGVQEKSHYAISVYLKELYTDKIAGHVINLLTIHRIERHESMYGLEYKPTKDDASTALADAKLFVNEMERVFHG